MEYFKDLAGVEYITVEHEGDVLGDNLPLILKEYAERGYTEFKLDLKSKTHITSKIGGSNLLFKLKSRGEKEAIRQEAKKWYPGLID